MTIRSIVGKLTNVAYPLDKNGNPYLKVTVLEPGAGLAPDGGRYPEFFSCFDSPQRPLASYQTIEEWVNENVTVTLEQNGKTNQNGRPYENIVDIQPGPEVTSSTPQTVTRADSSPHNVLYRPEASPWVEPPAATNGHVTRSQGAAAEGTAPRPEALGACQNNAMAFIESGIIPVPEGRDPLNFLRELRDRVYRDVNQGLYQSDPHYCYEHETGRKTEPERTDKWFHLIVVAERQAWCVEGLGIVYKDSLAQQQAE